jgi:ATP-binding cassette subfamily F protein 3
VNGDQSDPTAESKAKRLNPIKRKQMEDRVHQLEQEISRAEAAIASLETALQSFVSADQSQRQSEELDQHKASHAALMKEWEEFSQELSNSS